MAKTDRRVDEYIEKSAGLAQPVLNHLRELIHKACPEVEETIKWGMPFFQYKGPVCSFAAFKKHAVFGFWKHRLLKDPKGYLQENSANGGSAMGNFGRITSIRDLPEDEVLIDFIRQAKKLNDEDAKVDKLKLKQKKEPEAPTYFLKAISENTDALRTYQSFSPGKKREYVEWITEAKTEKTRIKRMATAVEWLAEGKPRMWKYISK